jgi:hypothetical protein
VMDTEAMLYIFGPMIALCIGLAIAFGCYSYASYKGLIDQ